MAVAYHLGGRLGAWVGLVRFLGIMAQSEMGGISGFLWYFRVFIAQRFIGPSKHGEMGLCSSRPAAEPRAEAKC